MASSTGVGRLERVGLREIWGDEARNFTPWLASDEALTLLSEVIGRNLELVGTEVAVGPYSADILARATGAEDHKIVIENQLGKTDHDHLGKMITYAAGLDAKTLIWVSDRFCDEHREALDWLNQSTGEKLAFFGLEVRAYRIDSSRPAPQFVVISSPNATTKAARENEPSASRPTREEMLVKAASRGVGELTGTLLFLSSPPDDYVSAESSNTYGGSFRCWRRAPDEKWKMVLGINISGLRRQTPDGQLDIWLPVQSIATVGAVPVEDVRQILSVLPIYSKETVDWLVRITNQAEARAIVKTLGDFFLTHLGWYANHG